MFSKRFLFFFFLITVFVAAFFLLRQKPPEPSTTIGVSWGGLAPGVSTKSQVEEKLGKPTKESQEGSQTISEFSSLSPTRSHVGVFDKETQKALFLKQIVSYKENESVSVRGLVGLYGNKSTILYGPDFVNGFALFVYPEKGVAYLGNSESDTVLEIWYFVPTDIESFSKTWATEYSSVPKNQPF